MTKNPTLMLLYVQKLLGIHNNLISNNKAGKETDNIAVT